MVQIAEDLLKKNDPPTTRQLVSALTLYKRASELGLPKNEEKNREIEEKLLNKQEDLQSLANEQRENFGHGITCDENLVFELLDHIEEKQFVSDYINTLTTKYNYKKFLGSLEKTQKLCSYLSDEQRFTFFKSHLPTSYEEKKEFLKQVFGQKYEQSPVAKQMFELQNEKIFNAIITKDLTLDSAAYILNFINKTDDTLFHRLYDQFRTKDKNQLIKEFFCNETARSTVYQTLRAAKFISLITEEPQAKAVEAWLDSLFKELACNACTLYCMQRGYPNIDEVASIAKQKGAEGQKCLTILKEMAQTSSIKTPSLIKSLNEGNSDAIDVVRDLLSPPKT